MMTQASHASVNLMVCLENLMARWLRHRQWIVFWRPDDVLRVTFHRQRNMCWLEDFGSKED